MSIETSINVLFLLVGILYILTILCYICIKRDYKKIKNDLFIQYTYSTKYTGNVKQYHDECIERITDQQGNILDIIQNLNDKYAILMELLIQRRYNYDEYRSGDSKA